MTTPGIPKWRRQAALFAAGVSALIGLGVLLVVWFAGRETARPAERSPAPVQTPAR